MTVPHRELLLTDVGNDTSNGYQRLGKLQWQAIKIDFSTKASGFQLWKFDTLEVDKFDTYIPQRTNDFICSDY